MAKGIMIQGTSSNVGKSVLVSALCRIFLQDGLKVVPFKSQNMANNSYVTRDGKEMGRAQAVQAEAAGLEPQVEMNPILLKPTADAASQVILLGKPIGNMGAKQYHLEYNTRALGVIQECLEVFHREYDVIVIEGAGSPAEVNLKERDIANMRVAEMARVPVILVTDIDRGGALASVVGTLELLEPAERERVGGIIINKFRGDVDLLRPALDFLEQKTGKPVLGVIPYFRDLRLLEEDAVVVEEEGARYCQEKGERLEIAVIALPRISNFTDFEPLAAEEDVVMRYVGEGDSFGHPDLIIIPGTKNTIEDMLFLNRTGLAEKIRQRAGEGIPVVGICGGYQILGREIRDPLGTESHKGQVRGLGLLPLVTIFEKEKITNQAQAVILGGGPFFAGWKNREVKGYEIHMGRTLLDQGAEPAFLIINRSDRKVTITDGAVSGDGMIFGTYLHGLFDNDEWRRHFLNVLRERKGWQPLIGDKNLSHQERRERDYDKLAEVVRKSLDMAAVYKIMDWAEGSPWN